jgi:hypothetical protein
VKRTIVINLMILLALLLVSCSSSSGTTAPTAYPAAEKPTTANPVAASPKAPEQPTPTDLPMFPYEGPYPYPGGLPLRASAQPTIEYNTAAYVPPSVDEPPTPTAVIPVVVPTPKADLGIVTGKLLSSDSGNPPYIATLYLGSTIPANKDGFPPMVSLSADTDPKGRQDETGTFVFTDIKPGLYALVIWDPYNSVVVQDEKKENYLTFEVKAGEITDLGTILYP